MFMLDMNNKIADKVTLVEFSKTDSNTRDLKEKLYDDLFKNLLLIKKCIIEHTKDLKMNDDEFIKVRLDEIRSCYSYGTKFYNNLKRHISIGNVDDKYENHANTLGYYLLQINKALTEADKTGVWLGEEYFRNLNEPIDKLLDMMNYDFGFAI